MRLFATLYDTTLRWSRHQHAPRYLSALSFAESSVFPIPPDVMLIPMTLARPQHAWRLAAITTLWSVLGGLFGYLLGYFLLSMIEPLLHQLGYWQRYQRVSGWFDQWGFWAIFVAGFSPVPYKLFTIAAGAIAMPLLPFVVASALGRGARFFLVAGLIRLGGERMESMIRTHVERLGWLSLIVVAVAYLVYRTSTS